LVPPRWRRSFLKNAGWKPAVQNESPPALALRRGKSMDAVAGEEGFDIVAADFGILIPHLVAGIGQDDGFVMRQEPSELFGNEAEEGIGLRAGEQQDGNADAADGGGLDDGEKSAGGHHDVPFMGVAERLVAGGFGHVVPGAGIGENVVDEDADAGVAIAAAEFALHGNDHFLLNVAIHGLAGFCLGGRKMLQERNGGRLGEDQGANQFGMAGGEEESGEGAIGMSDDDDFAEMQRVDEGGEILRVDDGGITGPGGILIGEIVAAAVSDGAETEGERADLIGPVSAVAERAVNEDHGSSVALVRVVQSDTAADVDGADLRGGGGLRRAGGGESRLAGQRRLREKENGGKDG